MDAVIISLERVWINGFPMKGHLRARTGGEESG